MKEQPMTDSTTPEGSNPTPDEPGRADETRKQAEDRSVDAAQPDEDMQAGEDTQGPATSAAPMTDSTDGGLDGGDPGVEE
jgi:hypothetical protein